MDLGDPPARKTTPEKRVDRGDPRRQRRRTAVFATKRRRVGLEPACPEKVFEGALER